MAGRQQKFSDYINQLGEYLLKFENQINSESGDIIPTFTLYIPESFIEFNDSSIFIHKIIKNAGNGKVVTISHNTELEIDDYSVDELFDYVSIFIQKNNEIEQQRLEHENRLRKLQEEFEEKIKKEKNDLVNKFKKYNTNDEKQQLKQENKNN